MKEKRHNKILEIIETNNIETQEELIAKLKLAGFDVTQATVSRDIRELKLLKQIADGHGVSISNVATRYILQQPGVAAAIVGVRNSRHVADNDRLFSFELDESELGAIRALLDRYPVLPGEPYTLERTSPRYRGIIKMKLNGE